MQSNNTVQNLHITKWKILQKSECLARFVAYVISCVVLSLMAMKCFEIGMYSLIVSAGTFLIVFLMCTCAYKALKEVVIIIKILAGKYEATVAKVLSSNFANPYYNGWGAASDRVLNLGNMKIVVGYAKSVALPIGSEAVVVFVAGVESPVVVENAEIFK